MKKIQIRSIAEINIAAREFLQCLSEKEAKVIAFYGSMGAGKTTFIKALCEELGVTDVVNSPTLYRGSLLLSGIRKSIKSAINTPISRNNTE